MASAFDPTEFLDAPSSVVNERRAVVPVENPDSPDGLYTAMIGNVEMACGLIGKGERVGQPWLQAVVPLELQLTPSLQQALGFDKPVFTVVDRPMLDLAPGATIDAMGKLKGSLDNGKGKNRAQKAYRDALDLNKPGDVFSWRQVQGKLVKVRIQHEMYNGVPQEKVSNVLKA